MFGPIYLFSAPASVIAGPVSPATTNLNAGFSITGSNNVEFTVEADSQINAGWLYVADSSKDQIVPLIIPRLAPNLILRKPLLPIKRPS